MQKVLFTRNCDGSVKWRRQEAISELLPWFDRNWVCSSVKRWKSWNPAGGWKSHWRRLRPCNQTLIAINKLFQFDFRLFRRELELTYSPRGSRNTSTNFKNNYEKKVAEGSSVCGSEIPITLMRTNKNRNVCGKRKRQQREDIARVITSLIFLSSCKGNILVMFGVERRSEHSGGLNFHWSLSNVKI